MEKTDIYSTHTYSHSYTLVIFCLWMGLNRCFVDHLLLDPYAEYEGWIGRITFVSGKYIYMCEHEHVEDGTCRLGRKNSATN